MRTTAAGIVPGSTTRSIVADAPYSDRSTANKYGGTARGDSMQARQNNAGQNQGARAGEQPAGNRGSSAGAGGRDTANRGNRPSAGTRPTRQAEEAAPDDGQSRRIGRGASAGTMDSNRGAAGNRVGNNEYPPTRAAPLTETRLGAPAAVRAAARLGPAASRGASSMGGSRGGGGGGGRGGGVAACAAVGVERQCYKGGKCEIKIQLRVLDPLPLTSALMVALPHCP